MKLNELVLLKDNFQYAINLKYDLNNVEKIENYIFTPGGLEVIENYIMSLTTKSSDRAKILIGPYGKGKSHLLLVLLSLLSDFNSTSSIDVIKRISEMNSELGERLEILKSEKLRMLPVVVTSSSLDMKQIILSSLMETLINNGLGHIMPESYYNSAINTINMWLTEFPDVYKKFISLIDIDIKDFISKLEDFDRESYNIFTKIYPSLTAGAEFSPMYGTEIDTVLVEVSKELSKYGYNGIFLVYDEFSKFLEGSIDKNSALDIKLLQDIAELCNRSHNSAQIHLTLISHKDISSYTDNLPKEKVDSWKAVSERFKRVEINNSKYQTYHLISQVLEKKEDVWTNVRARIENGLLNVEDGLIKNGLIRGFGFSPKNFVEMMYPLHPLTAILLPEIAELVAQNERTLFTFLASEEKKSVSDYIKKYDITKAITPEVIFDYFEEQYKKENFDSNIYKTWRSSKEICNHLATISDENKSLIISLVKTIALIQMVNAYESIPPTASIIEFAFIYDHSFDEIETSIEFLIKNNYLRYISSKGHYSLKSTKSIDIKSRLNDTIAKRSKMINLNNLCKQVLNVDALYPNIYNTKYDVVRYYVPMFVASFDFLKNDDYNNYDNNGVFLIVLLDDDSHYEDVIKKLMILTNNLLYAVVNKKKFNYIDKLYAFDALLYLIEENRLSDNDEVLSEEYEMELEEIKGSLKNLLEPFFYPSGDDIVLIRNGVITNCENRIDFNNMLSCSLEDQFSNMPQIINEMINRDNISHSIVKARDKIVSSVLKNDLIDNLGFTGHGPEVTIMRATLLSTGIFDGKRSIKTKGIENKQIQNVLDIIDNYLLKSSINGAQSFHELYDLLTSPKYKIGLKKGLIPIYLSVAIKKYKDHIVLLQNGHEIEMTLSVLNDINKNPKKYSVYLEAWDERKEQYLTSLKKVFNDFIEGDESDLNSFNYIVKAMHRWFLYLPRYSREHQYTYENDGTRVLVDKSSVLFRNKIKQNTINSREFIFETLPKIFRVNGFSQDIVDEIKKIKITVDNFLSELKLGISQYLIGLFGSSHEQTIYSAMHEWYDNLDLRTRNHKFDNSAEVLLNSLEYISNNHEAFLDLFTREIIGLSIDDWNDEKYPIFIDRIHEYKKTIETFNKTIQSEALSEIKKSNYEITFYDENASRKSFSFSNSGFSSSQALSFYDEISGVLDDYIYSIDKNEARQVLIELLKKVL